MVNKLNVKERLQEGLQEKYNKERLYKEKFRKDKSYSEKLKDPRWQRKRLEIFNRDGFECQRCFDNSATLVVHHKLYSKNTDPWDYDNCHLITLCEKCHSYFHNELEKKYLNDEHYTIYRIDELTPTDIYLIETRVLALLNKYKQSGVSRILDLLKDADYWRENHG